MPAAHSASSGTIGWSTSSGVGIGASGAGLREVLQQGDHPPLPSFATSTPVTTSVA